jgi:phospholipid-binding lipoprotein MlaA
MSYNTCKFVIIALVVWLSNSSGFAGQISDETSSSIDTSKLEQNFDSDLDDPLEPFNRGIFAFNEVLDGLLLKPAAIAFRTFLPEPVQDFVANFFDNLSAPVIFVNDVLQAEGNKAGETMLRFVINSTIGIAGLFDVAAKGFDIQPHKTDFGITLRSYGMTSGPYLFIPLIGPSTFADAIGRFVDFFIDPFNLIMIDRDHEWVTFARAGVQGVITRAKLLPITDNIDKTPDPYAQYRIFYLQNRDSMVKGEKQVERESPVPTEVIKANKRLKTKKRMENKK